MKPAPCIRVLSRQCGKRTDLCIDCADFAKATELLPLRSTLYADAANKGRATKGTAQAYLAKAYLYRPILERGQAAEFGKAEAELKKVIDNGEYKLVDNYRENSMWGTDYENNIESVFEIQMFNGPDWLGGDKSDSWRWQEIGVPDGTGGSWWNLAPNQRTYDEFEEGDYKFMTMWCPGVLITLSLMVLWPIGIICMHTYLRINTCTGPVKNVQLSDC